jgi:hypothetical protein
MVGPTMALRAKHLCVAQGGYYLLTGVWPVFHRASFETVTGPKQDYWLVVMVGLLAATIGINLLNAVRLDAVRFPALLAITSAVAFLLVDVVYSLSGTISRIYLADAVLQVVLICLWAGVVPERSRGER